MTLGHRFLTLLPVWRLYLVHDMYRSLGVHLNLFSVQEPPGAVRVGFKAIGVEWCRQTRFKGLLGALCRLWPWFVFIAILSFVNSAFGARSTKPSVGSSFPMFGPFCKAYLGRFGAAIPIHVEIYQTLRQSGGHFRELTVLSPADLPPF